MKYLLSKRELDMYMDNAIRYSQMSRCERLKVGAIIVKKKNIISFSWNGTVAGDDNCCEEVVYDVNGNPLLVTKPDVIHAEENAIIKLARSVNSGKNSILICTHSPCIVCSRMIYSTGIRTVYYKDLYRSDDGINYLIQHNVNVLKYGPS